MDLVDSNKNGYIDYSEFLSAAMSKEIILDKERMESAFKAFDSDGSGGISSEELKLMVGGDGNIGDQVWKELIKEVDTDEDGTIDLNEFKNMLLKAF